MGRMHYTSYGKIADAQVVAIADVDAKRAAGDLGGGADNIGGAGLSQLPMDKIRGTTDFDELLSWDDVDAVDICVPTPDHVDLAIKALKAGKHVICEKPLARTSSDAQRIADAAAAAAKGLFMPAMCIRFWPQWAWLKEAVSDKRYGKVLGATFRRVAQMPGGWFNNGAMSGGAVLDLHIHDTDFVYHLFGKPDAVMSSGYSKTTGEIDHLVTQYFYSGQDAPAMVCAEGGWCLSDGFGFSMRYTVNFENATADYDLARADNPLILSHNGKAQNIKVDGADDGWHGELAYFIDCVKNGRKPSRVTAADAVASTKIVEAESKSAKTGQRVSL
jgi:predicted dehydrogenase